MSRFFLSVLMASCLSSLIGSTIAAASTRSTAPAVDPSRDYWVEARRLAQNHLVLLNRIERSLSSSDGARLQAVRGQLFLQTSAVDRFLTSSYPTPEVLCAENPSQPGVGSVAGTDAVSLEEAQVYCALYASARELGPLRAQLDRRVGRVAEAAPRFLSLRSESLEPSQPPLKSPLRRQQTTLNFIPETATDPEIMGRVAKTPVESFVMPIAPAIQPPDDILAIVQSSRNHLLQVQSAFPVGIRFTVPVSELQSDRTSDDLYPQESQPYRPFLSQPNTGIARLLPSEAYRQSNPIENRLAPRAADQLPLAVLMQRSEGLSPRLAIQIEGGSFQMVQTDLNYGFMTDLGDVALETLPPFEKESGLSAALQFFYSYRPPLELEAIQADRRRFITGKVSDLNLSQPLLSQATAATNRTYLVRSIQFKIPEIITSKRSLLPGERSSLRDLLKTPSSDLLFAFRPVSRRADGSYTVLWKILTQFSDPQIRDLDRYVVKY